MNFLKKRVLAQIFGVCIGLITLVLAAQAASAATVYSNSLTGNDTTGDGSVSTPYKTFHKVYTAASAGDTIDLIGTFTWSDDDETGDVSNLGYTIGKNLTILGHGVGATIVQAAIADSLAYRRVFTVSAGVTATFKDLTVRYGRTTGSHDGGGIRNSGIVTIDGCWIYSNRSVSDSGGGLSNRHTMIVVDSLISNNQTYYMGGGINQSYYVDASGYLTVTNSTIVFNEQTSNYAYTEGGGIFLRQGNGTITNSTIAYNNSRGIGGLGIDDSSGTLTLKNNLIVNNVKIGSSYYVDFGYRSSGQGNVVDNGGNIVGYSQSYTFADSTDWIDVNRDGTFVLYDTATTGTVNMGSALSLNDSVAGVKTMGVSSGSIAIDNGGTGTNGAVSVPTTDVRGYTRSASVDIGSFEYNATYTVTTPTTQASSIAFSSVEYNQATVSLTEGNGSKRVVFMKEASSGTATPVDTTSYMASAVFGSGTQIGSTGWYAVYNGVGTSVTVTGLSSGTSYIVQAFEYHGFVPGTEKYITSSVTDNPNAQTTYTPVDLYVNSSTGNDTTGDGSSSTPYKTFYKTYTVSNSGDTIYATGTFTWTDEDETGDVSENGYVFTKDLNVIGGGPDVTIFQAASADNTADRRLFTVNSGVVATFQDLSVRYGKVSGSSKEGGGINNLGTTTITGCELYNNRIPSGSGGGGVSNMDTLTINNSTIYNNVVNYMGGGVLNSYNIVEGGYLTITNSTITNNEVTATTAYTEGGGVHFRQGSGTITNSTIAYNTACSVGGVGMDDANGTVTLKNNIFAGNLQKVHYYCSNGVYPRDFGFRQSGYGNVVDNGYNIVGATSNYTFAGTGDWLDGDRDGTFALYNVGTTGTLNIGTGLSMNDNIGGVDTLAVSAGGISINNAATGTNGSVSVPNTDQRGAGRTSSTDIGAFEYDGVYDVTEPTTQASSVSYSTVEYNQMTVSWTKGGGSRRVVFMKAANTGTAIPVDGTSYTDSAVFGSGTQIGETGWYAVYEGLGTSVTITGLVASTNYIVQAFEYNGITLGNEDYMVAAATGNPATQATYTPVTLYVNASTGDDDSGDGSTLSPYKTFHKGYTASNSGDTIDITGTFTWTDAGETGDATTTGYTLSKDLTIQGYGPAETIFQAASADDTATSRVFYVASGKTVTFQDLTVRYGKLTGSSNGGGGIRNDGTTTVNRSYIYSNRSRDDSGGGLSNRHILNVNNSTVTHNIVKYKGGGINQSYYVSDTGYMNITNSTIAYNEQTYAYAYTDGAGVFYRQGSGTVTNCTIAYNTAYGIGGLGMDDSSGTLTLKNNLIVNNIKRNSSYYVDFGFRSSGQGNVVDNGGNIVGTSQVYTFTGSTDWTDTNRDGTFVLYDTATTGSANLDSNLAVNDNPYGLTTLALLADGIAIDKGSDGDNGTVGVPGVDQRTAARSGVTDVGSYEYGGSLVVTEPTTQTSSLTFSSVAYTSMNVSWTNGNGSRRVVFAKAASTGTTTPVDATSYTANATFGSGTQLGETGWYTVYNGSGATVAVSGLTSANDYIFQVFEYNGVSTGSQDYLTSVGTNNPISQASATVMYDLTYNAGSGGTVTGDASQSIAIGGDGTAVYAVPNTGYSFVDWSDDSTDNPRTETSASADVTVTANFVINTYGLTYTVGSNGSLSGTVAQTVNHGANGVEVTATPSEGYSFIRWSDGVTTAARTDLSVTSSKGVVALFASPSDVVYVNSSTGSDTAGIGSADDPYKTFHKGYLEAEDGEMINLTGTFTWTDSDELGDYPFLGYTISKNITLRGHGPDSTIIQAAQYDNTADRRVFSIAAGSTVIMENLAVRYGKVRGYRGDGGGIKNSGSLALNYCEVYSNRTVSDSGGGISNRNLLVVNRSAVYDNFSYYMGGGIVNSYWIADGGYLTVTNSTIAFNQQTAVKAYTEGGGIHFRQGSGSITNSTIAYNTATGVGGVGMDDPDGTLIIKNSIIANNYKRNSSAKVDFGFRAIGRGNVTDNGGNIIGNSQHYTWSGSGDWIDQGRDGTFELYTVGTTGPLNLDTQMAVNNNTSKVHSLKILTGSVALNTGGSGSNGDVSVPTYDARGYARTSTIDIGSFEYDSTPSDLIAPVVSGVASTTTATTATITWTTDDEASSQVKYDATTIRSTMTPVEDVATKVTSHSVTIEGLIPCAKFYYMVSSRDASDNQGESGGSDYFATKGCAGLASVAPSDTITEASATPDDGGTVSHTEGRMSVGLTIPASFSENPTDVQVKSLDKTTAMAALDTPGTYTSIGDNVFDIKALESPDTTVSSFDSAITVDIDYEDEDLAELDEDSLWIHRNDGSDWFALDDCTVDASANTVSCTTTNFSVFGLFGQEVAEATTSTGGGVFIYDQNSKKTVKIGAGEVIDIEEFYDLVDLDRVDWRRDVVEWVLENGLMSGVSGNEEEGREFDIDGRMNRAQAAMIIARYLGMDDDYEVSEEPFDDVSSDVWYGGAVAYLKDAGVVVGKRHGGFDPGNDVLRAELFEMIVKARFEKDSVVRNDWEGYMVEPTNYFVDVAEGDWFAPYMYLAAHKRLLSGYMFEDLRFVKPAAAVSRAEAASMLRGVVD